MFLADTQQSLARSLYVVEKIPRQLCCEWIKSLCSVNCYCTLLFTRHFLLWAMYEMIGSPPTYTLTHTHTHTHTLTIKEAFHWEASHHIMLGTPLAFFDVCVCVCVCVWVFMGRALLIRRGQTQFTDRPTPSQKNTHAMGHKPARGCRSSAPSKEGNMEGRGRLKFI